MTIPTNTIGGTQFRDEGNAKGLKDRAREMAGEASNEMSHVADRAQDAARDLADTVRQHPYAAAAVAAGLAFAVGALWKMGNAPRRSRLDDLLARLPDIPDRDSIRNRIAARWR
jgi:hypothetical protein